MTLEPRDASTTFMKCLYCELDKPEKDFRKAEHIVPQSFGRFKGNLVLHGKICDDCNQQLGDELEVRLARDTYEGLERFRTGVKQPKDYRHLGGASTLVFRVREGSFRNSYAYVEYSAQKEGLVLKPLDQVGFKELGSEVYEFFPLSRFPEENTFDTSRYDLKAPRSIVVLSNKMDECVELLRSVGVALNNREELAAVDQPVQDVLLEITSTIDELVRRAMAKIGFNYFAYWNRPDVLLSKPFDLIRQYIRNGGRAPIPLVSVSDEPILADEPQEGLRRQGHLVAVSWNDFHNAILAKVSLFNNLTFTVILSFGFSDLPVIVDKGSFWNTADMTVLELGARKRRP